MQREQELHSPILRIEARRDRKQAGKGRDQEQEIESDSNRADAVAEHERRATRNFVGQTSRVPIIFLRLRGEPSNINAAISARSKTRNAFSGSADSVGAIQDGSNGVSQRTLPRRSHPLYPPEYRRRTVGAVPTERSPEVLAEPTAKRSQRKCKPPAVRIRAGMTIARR